MLSLSPKVESYWIVCIVLSLASVLFYAQVAAGNAYQVIPTLKVKQEFSDNLFFSEQEKMSDWISTASPRLMIENDTETANSMVSAGIDWVHYNDNDEFDSIDHDYLTKLDARLNARATFSGQANYAVDSRRDRDLEETGLLLGNTERIRQKYLLSGGYELSNLNSVAFSYAFNEDDYDDPEIKDSVSQNLNFGMQHQFDFADSSIIGNINVGATRYNYPAAEVDNYTLKLGLDWPLCETMILSADIGGRYTNARFDFQVTDVITGRNWSEDKISNEFGAVGDVKLKYSGLYTNYAIEVSRDIATTSGRSNTSERTAVSIQVQRWFTDKLSTQWGVRYYFNSSDSDEYGAIDIEEHTWHLNSSVKYKVSTHIQIEAYYYYTRVEDKEVQTSIDRNLTFLQCRLEYDLFE